MRATPASHAGALVFAVLVIAASTGSGSDSSGAQVGHAVRGVVALVDASSSSEDIFNGQFCGGVLIGRAQVLTAAHGQEALGYLNGHRVDAIVTDLFMPEMDGIEVIAAVRRQFPDVRVIAISGRPGVDYLTIARELGVTHTLRKPFEFDELLGALKGVG